MKITKRQLKRIIRESVLGAYGSIDAPEYQAGYEAGYNGWEASDKNNEYLEGYAAGLKDADGKDDLEYDRGYEDGLDGYPVSSNANTSYDAGYEDGSKDATMSEGYNSSSPAGKSQAARVKRRFRKQYPDAVVKIDNKNGWINVNGRKAVSISQASGRPMDDEEMFTKLEAEL